MRRVALILAVLLSVGVFAERVSAQAPVFQVLVTGKKFCGNFDVAPFSRTVFVRVDSQTQISISSSPDFSVDTFVADVVAFLTSARKETFVAGANPGGGAFATAQGTISFNKLGVLTSLRGTTIDNNIFFSDCFTSGKFRSVAQ